MRIVRPFGVAALALLAATAVQAQTSAAARKDRAALQGEWEIVSASRDGQAAPAQAIRNSRRSAHGDTTIVMVGGQMVLRATFRLDPSKKPKTIDYRVLGGNPPAGSLQLGIYDFMGDMLRFCFAPPGAPRPTEMTTHTGDLRTCSVWRRAKP